MANTGFENFDNTVQQTNKILVDIEKQYGWQDRRTQSYTALSEVLKALRDRLPVNEAVHFGSQLPMLLRGVYYEGWEPENVPSDIDKDEFLQRIRENFQYSLEDGDIEELTQNVLNIVMKSISKGQAKQIKNDLPEDISTLIKV